MTATLLITIDFNTRYVRARAPASDCKISQKFFFSTLPPCAGSQILNEKEISVRNFQ